MSSAQWRLLQLVKSAMLSWRIVELLANSCTISLGVSYDFEWFMAVCWRGHRIQDPTSTDRACTSLTSSPVTSSTNFILRSICQTMQWFFQGASAVGPPRPRNSAMTMPCRAASPGSNRCFNLCQALKPSSSLMLITTFFDSLSMILRNSLQRLVCCSITLPYFVSRACLQRS